MLKSITLEKKKLINVGMIIVILFLFILFHLSTFTTWFRSDSSIYYGGICNSVENLKNGEITLTNFGIAGHMCYGYSLFVFLGQLFIPYYGIGVRIANLFMAVITIFIFWKLLKVIFPKLDVWTRTFATGMFAFSPMLLGITAEVHTDFPVLCFFIWMVYCYVTGHQTACLLTGLLLCFSKETGVIFYCTFFLGCFLYRLVKNENKNWFKKLFEEFSASEWMLLVPPDLFLIASFFSKGWGGSAIAPTVTEGTLNTFTWNVDYIWLKIREIFLMNFAWLLIVPLLLFVWAICKRKLVKIETKKEWLIGLGVSMAAFVVFNCAYYTYTHYRYLQLYLCFFVILVVLLLEKSTRNLWIKRSISLLFMLAFLVESFVTVDPVTFALFRNIDTGEGSIITTSEFAKDTKGNRIIDKDAESSKTECSQLNDAIAYNREYLGIEKVFEKAFTDIGYDETKAIVMPAIYNESMYFTNFAYFGVYDSSTIHWDKQTENIVATEERTPIQWLDISKGIPEKVSAYEEIWYVKLSHFGKWYEEENLQYFDVVEERTYESGKWKIILERIEYKG